MKKGWKKGLALSLALSMLWMTMSAFIAVAQEQEATPSEPTAEPTVEPTAEPTVEPTAEPTPEPEPCQQHEYKFVSDASGHYQVCSACGAKTAMEQHDTYTTGECTYTVKCKVCDYVVKEGTEHQDVVYRVVLSEGGSGYHEQYCNTCERSISAPEPHRMTDSADCTVSRRCTLCGYTTAASDGHALSGWHGDQAEGHWRACSNSGCAYTENEPHDFAWVLDREPTLDEEGWETWTCTVCGYQIGRTIPKLTWEEWVQQQQPATPSEPEPVPPPAPGRGGSSGGSSSSSSKATAVPETTPDPLQTQEQTVDPESLSDFTKDVAGALGAVNVEELLGDKLDLGKIEVGGKEFRFKDLAPSEVIVVSKDASVAGEPVPAGKLIVRATSISEGREVEGRDAYAAFVVAWEAENGEYVEPGVTMRISLPMSMGEEDEAALVVPTDTFKLIRIDTDVNNRQVLTEVAFSYADGLLTFEMDHTAVYLLIPADPIALPAA